MRVCMDIFRTSAQGPRIYKNSNIHPGEGYMYANVANTYYNVIYSTGEGENAIQ